MQVIKRYKRTGGADKASKTEKVMVCEFHFNPEQIWVSLGIGRKKHIYQEVYCRCFNLNLQRRKKKENLPKPHNKQETSCEFEAESESSYSQCLGDTSNSATDFPEDI